MTLNRPYVLMLEDDSDDRHITSTFFSANGYNVDIEFLGDSDELVPYLKSCESEERLLPCLILLDKNIPVGGGMPVLRSIKSHPIYKMIPVVMISGTASPVRLLRLTGWG